MNYKTIISFLALLLAVFCPLLAQQTNIKGRITDSVNKTPVEYANISLLKQDSTFVRGAMGDENGYFDFENIHDGNYILSTSFIGYETQNIRVSHSQDDSYIEIQMQPSAISLNEVAIVAKSVINKADRKLILPSSQQVKSSTDGLDLLKKMQLPRIMVDPITSEVTMSGNAEIQLRINGVLVTSAEVSAIKPDDIIRIEYHDDPSVRYGKAEAVIDYITKRKESGGGIRGSVMNNIGGRKTSADDLLSMKFNHRKSEFLANAIYQHRKQDWTREYDETFVYPTHELHRLEVGEPTAFDKKRMSSNFNYSILEKDKYFFNAQLRYNYVDFPAAYGDRKSSITTSNSDQPLSIYDHSTEKSNSPALDLYYQHNLKNEQVLIFNVVGTYINSKNTRIYHEQRENVLETDIYSKISGHKYSLIGEGIYERKIGEGKLIGGLKHSQTYTDNDYTGTTMASVSMNQSESDIYGEYQIKMGKWSYMANLTASRLYYSQDEDRTTKYSVQPSARIAYNPNNDLYFRYRVNLESNTPSLAYLNNVEQIIDPLQVRKGNPNLNSFRNLKQSFSTGYSKGIFGVDLLVNYDYQFKPIMESVLYEGGMFVRTYENQKSFQNLGAELTFNLKPWKDHINLSVTPMVNRFISRGNSYLHTYTMKEFRVNLDINYKNYVTSFTTITPPRSLYGEQLNINDQMYTIMVGYKQPKWSAMIGALSPFTKNYKAKTENWSSLNPVRLDIHSTNTTQMLFVKLSFNLDFGKQMKSRRKQINNSDHDSGIMSGAKS